ncbi:MAG: class I tRNA ligase family protein [Desulfobacterales bacterium]|nr:class I tRNA ligase family protein [Desulfobacterales bacterium]
MAHSYPHCWRCKQPVIFRATPQWFISMDKTGLRRKALEAIDRVKWIPGWGRERIYGMIENRPDWCVSRQRAWGVPITVFYCDDCGALLLDEEIMRRVHDLFSAHGADIWFEKPRRAVCPPAAACAAVRRHGPSKRKPTSWMSGLTRVSAMPRFWSSGRT